MDKPNDTLQRYVLAVASHLALLLAWYLFVKFGDVPKYVMPSPEATLAALIPITKSAAWWSLAQDERREILEDRSRHIAIGLEYLPAVARRLHHGRDLGEDFDFLTWFEFPQSAVADFDELLRRLRATEEWTYVEREVDIRVSRIG